MIEVKQSAIHGRGLFATSFIPEGTVIGDLKGDLTRENGDHVLWLNEHIGLRVTNEFQYINHAPQPNAAYFDDLTVMSLRDIHPGEELTHDYNGDGDLFGDDDFIEWEEDEDTAVDQTADVETAEPVGV